MTALWEFLFASRRRFCALVFVLVAGLIGAGLYLQHVVGLEPCPLCILQRYVYVLVGVLALASALTRELPSRIAHGAAILFTAAGAATAGWHVWLQYNPPVEAACGPTLGYLLGELPWSRALPRIFKGTADCAAIEWSFLGLSIAGWSLVWFVVIFVTMVLTLRRAR